MWCLPLFYRQLLRVYWFSAYPSLHSMHIYYIQIIFRINGNMCVRCVCIHMYACVYIFTYMCMPTCPFHLYFKSKTMSLSISLFFKCYKEFSGVVIFNQFFTDSICYWLYNRNDAARNIFMFLSLCIVVYNNLYCFFQDRFFFSQVSTELF